MAALLRLWAITKKEFRHITRDFRVFFLVSLSPAFLLLILAYLFALDVSHVSIGWMDSDRSATSRDMLSTLTADGSFQLTTTPSSYAEIDEDLLYGRADVVLVVPPGFEHALLGREPGRLQAVADGSDALSTAQSLGSLAARVSSFGTRLWQRGKIIDLRTRAWYNGDLKSLWSMVPGLLAIVLVLPALALTLAVTREGETGTLEALIATPLRGPEYLLGKLIAYATSGLLSVTAATALAVYWFGVPFRGSFPTLLAMTLLYYLATMGLSLFIAQIMKSQQTAMLLELLIFFVPGFFISGLIQPVNTSSVPGMLLSYSLPITHMVTVARGVFLKGVGFEELRFQVAALGATGLVSIVASTLLFRKRMR
jgi:ABC-2 type transport system permease protein